MGELGAIAQRKIATNLQCLAISIFLHRDVTESQPVSVIIHNYRSSISGSRVCTMFLKVKGKKVYIYTPCIPISSADSASIGTTSFTVSYHWGECNGFSAAGAIHTVPICIPPGTHCSWVARSDVDSQLAQGFLHVTSAAGIEPQTPISWLQLPNQSAMRSIYFYLQKYTIIIYWICLYFPFLFRPFQ